MSETDEWSDQLARLRKRKPAEGWVTIPDQDAKAALYAAEDALAVVRRDVVIGLMESGVEDPTEDQIGSDKSYAAAAKAVENAAAEVDATDVVFHFRAIGPSLYDQMQFQHPPTKPQEDRDMAYNPDTFIPAVIAACSVKPTATATS